MAYMSSVKIKLNIISVNDMDKSQGSAAVVDCLDDRSGDSIIDDCNAGSVFR